MGQRSRRVHSAVILIERSRNGSPIESARELKNQVVANTMWYKALSFGLSVIILRRDTQNAYRFMVERGGGEKDWEK